MCVYIYIYIYIGALIWMSYGDPRTWGGAFSNSRLTSPVRLWEVRRQKHRAVGFSDSYSLSFKILHMVIFGKIKHVCNMFYCYMKNKR